ncbi:MAG: zinc metallopeptidase [Calditrichia bacterium]|nr:zinc metallopeptidase [Calditrichia bacterium]
MILLIPAIILAIWAQMRVSSTYSKYSKISSARGATGAETAKFLLEHNGLPDVKIEAVKGKLSDHYDPRSNTVRLSTDNYRGRSLSAIAVAAHEVGHAIQHGTGYIPLKIRHSILPATNLGSWAAFPLFIIGFLFNTPLLMDIGIILFAGVVIFHFVTLPVEFNASHRALAQLSSNGMLVEEEMRGARKVLNAAALTYVAATAVALIHLVRLLILRGND